MYPSFDAFEYIDYVRRRWRVIAIGCVVAVLLAGGVSLLLPKKYTATASVVIEPPGGSDARLTTAVSAMYMESLKTYELFGNSPTLFARAAGKFHLRSSDSQSLESLQRQVLKVAKVRDTKVLEVSATLRDAKTAQALAQYVAEETVAMSHRESLASDQDFSEIAETQAAEAKRRADEAQNAWNTLSVNEPIESLQAEIDADISLRAKLEEQLATAESDAAEYRAQAQDGPFAREQATATEARAALLAKRSREIQESTAQKSATLAARTAKRQALQMALKVAQQNYESVAGRLQDSRATAGTHSEQLRVIDPGVVPQRPSSPNIPLNVIAAFFAALILSIAWLSFAFVFSRKQHEYDRPFVDVDAEERRRELRI
jgi:uncharacterized protein involved in exopolysaccharide biosynthesis